MTNRFLFFFFLLIWSCSSSARRLVCSITINSSDEIEVFKEQIGSEDEFDFVELVPLFEESRPNSTHWFPSACRKNYQCDILLISGHFGQLFFGEEHNYILPVEMMEEQACSHTCSGLLSNVKEVFLFGCNTLAGKNRDSRSPEEYLQVLLDHNMARDMAEIVTAGRYMPLGLSFEEQMRIVFAGSARVYGFSSLSPLGKDIRRPLRNYFQEIKQAYGSYSNYLEKADTLSENSFFRKAIGGSVKETRGLSPKDPDYPEFQKICRLYDSSLSTEDGMALVQEMMQSNSGARAFSAIRYFVFSRQPFSKESLKIFNAIKNDSVLRESFYSLYEKLSFHLPYVRIQTLSFLNSFGWLNRSFYHDELKSNALTVILQPDSSAYDFVTALIYDEQAPLNKLFTVQDFPAGFYNNVWSPLIMEALNMQDYLVHRRLMNLCLLKIQEQPVICYQVLKSLGHLNVSDALVVSAIARLLSLPYDGIVYYAMYALSYARTADPEIHRAIARHLNHANPWIQLQTVRALGFLKSTDEEVNQQLIQFLAKTEDEEMIYESLKSLRQMRPSLKLLKQAVLERELYKHANSDIKALAHSF